MSTPDLVMQQPAYGTQRTLLFAAVTVVAALGSKGQPAGQGWMLLALVAVSIAIWHGAFDGVLAEQALRPRLHARWKVVFYIAYLTLAALIALLWWVAPVVALAGFLLYSALHFGTEAELRLSPAKLLLGTATGLVPIAAACRWWPGDVAGIFTAMLRGDAAGAGALTAIAGAVLWPAVAATLLSAGIAHRSAWIMTSVLVLTELVLFRWCPPLVAFAVFFCLWHTPEHMVSTSLSRSGHFEGRLLLSHLKRGLAAWLVSLGAVALACWWGRHELQAYAGGIFIVLSALTVPHMVLAELCRRQARADATRPRPQFASEREGARA